MVQRYNRLVIILFASLLALFLVACSGDEDDKKDEAKPKTTPEFISTPVARSGGALPEPAFVTSGPTSVSATTGGALPPPSAASASRATAAANGITVRHVETATLPADQAFVVA